MLVAASCKDWAWLNHLTWPGAVAVAAMSIGAAFVLREWFR